MATTAKTSEAQRIVDDLVDRFGMAGAAIAREIGVKADTIQNIKGRRATGNLQLHRLRMLRDQALLLTVVGLRALGLRRVRDRGAADDRAENVTGFVFQAPGGRGRGFIGAHIEACGIGAVLYARQQLANLRKYV